MASPNALIHLEIRFRLLHLIVRSVVVFTLESDLRSPSRARRTYPRLVRPEQEQKPVNNQRYGFISKPEALC